MTIQQHASFDSSAAELNATSKLVKAWESKNAKNAAKAGGISMMALSLAACGGSSTTTTTTTTPVVDEPVVVTPTSQTKALTTGVDTIVTGGADDVINAGLDGANQTFGALDTLDGGAGSDTLNLILAATTTPSTVVNIESINIASAAAVTFNMVNVSGYTALSNVGSTDKISVTNISSADVALSVSNTAVDASFAYGASALTGTADTVSLTVSQATADSATTLVGAIETVNLTSSGSANAIELNSDATTLNISGDQDVTLNVASTIMNLTTVVDASAATGKVTLAHDHTTAATAVTITGGSGNDSITLAGTNAADDTVSGGAGDDTITFTTALSDKDTVDGGTGEDTIVGTTANLKALTTANLITNVEAATVSNAHTGTLKAASIGASVDTITLAAGSNGGTVTFGAGDATLGLGTSSAGTLTVNDTGLGTTDSLAINSLKSDNSGNGKAVTINGFETVTYDTSNAAGDETVAAVDIVGDADADGVRTSATLKVTGAGDFGAAAITLGAATGAGTIDASGLTGAFSQSAQAVGVTTITGGSGADTILGGDLASTLSGGAGADDITGGSKADVITGGAGDDVLQGSAESVGNYDTVSGGAGKDTFKYDAAELVKDVTLDGGDGADTLSIQDLSAVTDADLTGVTSMETITSAAAGLSVTLGAEAAEAGIATVTLAGTNASGIADSVTVAKEYSATALTVKLDALADGGGTDDSNTVDASAYTGSVTFSAAVSTALTGAATNAAASETAITGGSGTGDVLSTVGGTYTNAHLTGVKGIESYVVSDDVTSSFTLDENNAADGKTLLVDGRAIVDTAKTFAVNAADDTDGIITVQGSAGVDTLTGSASDNGDTFHGNAGADNFVFAAANLTKLDTVDGGVGTDTVKIAIGTTVDADFTNVTNIEALTFTGATTATLAAEYSESGSATVTLTTGTNSLTMDAVTTDQTVVAVAGTDTIDASDMTANLILKIAEDSVTSADTVTGGKGTSDKLLITFDAGAGDAVDATDLGSFTGFEVIEVASNIAASLTTADANTAATASLLIDMSKNTTATSTVSVAAETNAAVTIQGGSGTNAVTMSQSSIGDTYTGGTGADNLTIAVANLTSEDTINAVSGTDKITMSSAGVLADSDLTNVSNFDTLVMADGTNTFVLGAEYAGAGFTKITTAGTGNDSITLGTGVTTAQTIELTGGDDTLVATGASGALSITITEDLLDGSDTITGGSGADTLTITYDTDGSGTDTLTAAELAAVTAIETIVFASNVEVDGFTTADANIAKDASMTIDATKLTSAAATVSAAAETNGSITYTGGAGVDTVTGGAKNDTISGNAGADVITGGKGGDTLAGGAGADTFSYTAADQSTGTAKDSITDFTAASDKIAVTIDQSTATAALTVDATVQTAQAGTSAVQSNLSGSIGQAVYDTTNSELVVNMNADNLVTTLDLQIGVNAAATAANTILAGDLNFTITTGSGADTIVTGAGVDAINSGAGADTISSGAGADTITLTADSTKDIVKFGANEIGTATAASGAVDVDELVNWTAGSGADVISISVSAIEGLSGITDLIVSGKSDVSVAAGDTAVVTNGGTTVTNAAGAVTTNIFVFEGASALTEAAIETGLENGNGTNDLEANVNMAVGDAYLVVADDGTDSALFVVVVGGDGVANDTEAAAGELTAIKIADITGLADVGTLDATNFAFIA
ncbi:hypothetical protein N9747_05390 [Planktomarina sp.]|nr:hypothetical protein [Planktomarina sp.]